MWRWPCRHPAAGSSAAPSGSWWWSETLWFVDPDTVRFGPFIIYAAMLCPEFFTRFTFIANRVRIQSNKLIFCPLAPPPGCELKLWIKTVNWRLCGSGSKKIGSFFIVFQEQNLKVFFVLGRTYHLLSSVGTRTGTELYRVPMHWRLPVYKKRSGLTWQSPAAPPAAISLVTGRLPSFRVNLGQKKNS